MPRKTREERQESMQLAFDFEKDKRDISSAGSTLPPAGWRRDQWRLLKQINDLHRELAELRSWKARHSCEVRAQ